MKEIIESIVTLAFTISFILGAGKSFIWLHDKIKNEALTTVSKGLSSTEELSKALTGQ